MSNYTIQYVALYGGVQSKKGGVTKYGKRLFDATKASGGRITALAPPQSKIFSRRLGRAFDGGPSKGDQRSQEQLKGTLAAPYTQYGFLSQIRKKWGADVVSSFDQGFVS